jgi:ribosomal protein S27AE
MNDGNNDTTMIITNRFDNRQEQGHKRSFETNESSGDHEWTVLYDYNDNGHNGKERKCQRCGVLQRYGHRWGSRRKGGFESVNIACPGIETKKAHQVHGDDGEHSFGPKYSVNNGGSSYHERECQTCGMKQKYGVKYGSKRTPGYESVDPKCGETLHI